MDAAAAPSSGGGGTGAQHPQPAAPSSANTASNSNIASTAAESLLVLLRDDPLLSRLGLTDPPDWHADDHQHQLDGTTAESRKERSEARLPPKASQRSTRSPEPAKKPAPGLESSRCGRNVSRLFGW